MRSLLPRVSATETANLVHMKCHPVYYKYSNFQPRWQLATPQNKSALHEISHSRNDWNFDPMEQMRRLLAGRKPSTLASFPGLATPTLLHRIRTVTSRIQSLVLWLAKLTQWALIHEAASILLESYCMCSRQMTLCVHLICCLCSPGGGGWGVLLATMRGIQK